MDSQLAAVLTHGRASLLNRAQIPQDEGKLMEPLKETKGGPEIQPMDLSLKSSSSPTSSSRPLSLNQTTTSHNEAKHIHCKDESLQGRILGEVEDYKENTSLEDTGVHHPILPNIGSTPACTKDFHTSALTRCLLEQRGVLSASSPTELSHQTSLTLVTVKEEIEEVCIGEMEGHSEGDSDSVVSLSEIIPEDKDSVEDSADGSYFHSTFVTEPQKNTDGIAAIKKELDDIATDVCRTETKEAEEVKASVVDTQTLDLNGNISYFSEAVTGLDTKTQTNTGSSSGSDKLMDAGLSVQQVELKREKCKKLEKACFTVVPAHSIGTRSQRKREMEKNTSLYKDGRKLEVVQSSVLLFSDPPTGCGGLSNSDKESLLEENLNEMVKGKGIKRGIDGEEVLDLSFSRKTGRNGTDRKEAGFKKGTGNESTLVMEVEEIVQQEATEKESNEAHVTFEEPHWDSTQSPSPTSPSSFSSPVDPDLAELLLIDDQGIPYRLTPDGQKVLQVASPKPCIGPTISQPKPTLKLGLAEESPDISTAAFAPSNRGSAHSLPIMSPKKLSPCLTSAVSLESSTAWKPILPLNTKFSTETAVLTSPPPPSSVSNMTPQPVRILANSASNILLVPSSHLSSPSLSKTSPSSGLLTVSLPLSLSQNSPSAPLLLVLSPLTASPAPPSSSSSSSPLTMVDPIPSSVLISNNQSSSSVAHSLSSGSVDLGSSSTSSALLPAHNLNSISSTTSISGNSNQTIPNLASPSVSPVATTKKSKPDLNSETVFPKRSPRLLKANFPSEPKSTSTTEAKTESETSCVPNSLSPVKTRQPLSPQTTPNPLVPHSSKKGLSPVAQPAATSHTPEELISNDPLYRNSSTPPPTPIFPTNHPKNLSLSPTCPRRILYCQFCPRAFYYLSDLERHSITHSQSKPHVCPLCSKAFKRSSHLERHKHIHTGQRNFICPICSKRFREAGELLRHQRVHTGEKPFQCPQCHMRFAERNTLRRHTKRKHHDGQPGEDGQLEGGHASDSMQGGQEESAEWYSCSVPDLDSDTEPDRE